jgi:glycosyltransferase involved in cell wall biosynthesis
MISIIICSREKTISKTLQDNLHTTVGCEYELIVIDNSENKYSIFEAYNLGINKSSGEILCFLHDDILIHTQNWGIVIANIFNSNSAIGLVGVAGSKIKTKMPSAWWDCENSCKRMNLIQHFASGEIKDWQIGWNNETMEEVVAIDGVFMMARKVEGIKFNEELNGFHNYDLNLSFEYIKNGFEIMVTKDILIEHFSIGKLDESWYNSTLRIHKMYKKILPLSTLISYDFKKQEFKNGSRFTTNLMSFKLKRQAFNLWIKLICFKPISKFHFEFIKIFLK